MKSFRPSRTGLHRNLQSGRSENKKSAFTISGGEVTLVAAAGFVGEVLVDVHVSVHLVPYLFQRGVQIGLPVLLIHTVDELSQLNLSQSHRVTERKCETKSSPPKMKLL